MAHLSMYFSHMRRPGLLFWMGFTMENLPVAPAQTARVGHPRFAARKTVKQWSGQRCPAAKFTWEMWRCDGGVFGGSMAESIPQCEAPKIAKLVYNSNNYGLWYL